MKRENWLINAYEKTTKHMMGGGGGGGGGGGLTRDHTVVNCNDNNEKKKTLNKQALCVTWEPFHPHQKF